MKGVRLFLVLVVSIISINAFLAFSYTIPARWGCCVDNRWNTWSSGHYMFDGYWNDFVIYSISESPWCFALKVKVNGGSWPSKSEIKERKKKKGYFSYDATIEYWVCDKYPTIKDILKTSKSGIELVDNPESYFSQYYKSELGNIVKRTTKGKVYLLPDYDMKAMNVFFDDIGIGINIQ